MSKSPEQHITTYAGNIVIVKYAMPFQFRVVKHSLSVDAGSDKLINLSHVLTMVLFN